MSKKDVKRTPSFVTMLALLNRIIQISGPTSNRVAQDSAYLALQHRNIQTQLKRYPDNTKESLKARQPQAF
ncbi:hypothetical protein E4K67_01820 [Desulfosporosinus fructosivorans]|uniref:Transposase n=1 Tax=Desulfosporosinus fructosivorans TaxID=2018669 RepID=A0A4Z0RC58_9FIRM|nr:hypothetical protein E4K67_01820 [Desulfosporosinus fructosivorans]